MEQLPDLSNAYRLVRQLGQGGMGSVYLGVREDDLQIQAAIKVLHHPHENARARFLRERQILAKLQHPNIARILDGGVTADGRLWYAMDYIEGVTLDVYVAEQRPGIEALLALFKQICDAVSYAHGALVIHSDLKPTNIMVTPAGRPVLLDFGIAFMLDPDDASGSPEQTRFQNRAYTPHYASPEQVRGLPLDTTTDVYALGVVLYELLAQQKPYLLDDCDLETLLQTVCHYVPTKPSTAIGKHHSKEHYSKLVGDLDNIVMKALAKQPNDRYASVADLKADLDRYQAHLPVMARSHSWVYVCRRFLRRNLRAVLAVATVFLLLVIALVVSLRQTHLAEQRRQEAEAAQLLAQREKESARKATAFLSQLFSDSNPVEANDRDMTIEQVLEVAADSVASEYSSDPQLQGQLYESLASVFRSLGDYERSMDLLRLARDAYAAAGEMGSYVTVVAILIAHPAGFPDADEKRAIVATLKQLDVSVLSLVQRREYVYILMHLHQFGITDLGYEQELAQLENMSPDGLTYHEQAEYYQFLSWAYAVKAFCSHDSFNHAQKALHFFRLSPEEDCEQQFLMLEYIVEYLVEIDQPEEALREFEELACLYDHCLGGADFGLSFERLQRLRFLIATAAGQPQVAESYFEGVGTTFESPMGCAGWITGGLLMEAYAAQGKPELVQSVFQDLSLTLYRNEECVSEILLPLFLYRAAYVAFVFGAFERAMELLDGARLHFHEMHKGSSFDHSLCLLTAETAFEIGDVDHARELVEGVIAAMEGVYETRFSNYARALKLRDRIAAMSSS